MPLRVIAASGAEGLTARQAAEMLFDTRKPTGAQVEKGRRKLAALVTSGHLTEVPGHKGSGSAASWHLANVLQDVS